MIMYFETCNHNNDNDPDRSGPSIRGKIQKGARGDWGRKREQALQPPPYTMQVRLYSTTVNLADGVYAGIQYGAAALKGGRLAWAITENASNCLAEGICSL